MPELELSEPKIVPKSEIDKQAEELRNKRSLPKKPGDRVNFSEFQDWIKIVSDQGLERLMVYVYRLEPVINRQIVDPRADNNIDVISGENLRLLSEDYFITNHGGGRYELIVRDLDAVGKEKGQSFRCSFTINTLNNPPKLDLREVEWDNPKNKGYKSWARAAKLIDERNMPVEIEKKESSNDGKAMVDAMKLAMDFASKMSQKDQEELKRRIGAEDSLGRSIGDILLEKMKQDDPNKQVQTLTALLAAIKPNGSEDKGMVALIVPLITMMNESNKQMMTVMLELFKSQQSQSSNKGDERDEVSKLKDLIDIAKELKGSPRASEKSVTEQLIEAGSVILPKVFDTVNGIIAIRSHALNPTQPAPKVSTMSQTINQEVNNQQPTNQQPQAISAPESAQIIAQFGPLIEKHLGNPGYEFAALVEEMFGAETIAIAIKNGPMGLLEGAKTVSQFWNKVVGIYGEPHLTKWLTEFCNYKEELAKLEDEEEVEEGGKE